MIKSMTGFGQSNTRVSDCDVSVSIISVNSRFLDLKLSLPEEVADMEMEIRRMVAGRVARGNLKLGVRFLPDPDAQALDGQALREYLQDIRQFVPEGITPTVDLVAACRLRDIYTRRLTEEEMGIVMETVERALAGLEESRAREGEKTRELLVGMLDQVSGLLDQAESQKETEMRMRREKIAQNLEALVASDDELRNRLMFEVSAMLAKMDAKEELERFRSHIESFRESLDQGGAVGKRLEFLCQEMHREANTLSGKSVDPELIGVSIKMRELVEQIKEQVRNIE